MGAIGLFAMAIGFTLLALDRPSRARVVGLTLTLLAIFFTHIYRFPFALAAVVGTTVVMYPATRRFRPVMIPLGISLAAFGIWRLVRRETLASPLGTLTFNWERRKEIAGHLFGSYTGPEEQLLAVQMMQVTLVVFALSLVLFFVQGRHRGRSTSELWWGAGVTVLPLLIAVVYLGCYFVLPMSIGTWWFVYRAKW